jgi:hypothetical protein
MTESSLGLLGEIEQHLARTRTAPSRFGRDIVGDPRFVFDLRRGRHPSPRTQVRIRQILAGGVA